MLKQIVPGNRKPIIVDADNIFRTEMGLAVYPIAKVY